MPSLLSLIPVLAGFSLVSAHATINKIDLAGQTFDGWDPVAQTPQNSIAWQDSAADGGFVAPSAYTTSDIACHRDGKAATASATVAAGGNITVTWSTWNPTHKGPVLNYLAPYDGDSAAVKPEALEFFKIDEAGLGSDGFWASDALIANGNRWDVTIPTNLQAGHYVLRHEVIGLHRAAEPDGAENYPHCFSIEVTGDGSEQPAGTPATSLYTPNDAGIKVDIYADLTAYAIPGPKPAFSADGTQTTQKRRHARQLT